MSDFRLDKGLGLNMSVLVMADVILAVQQSRVLTHEMLAAMFSHSTCTFVGRPMAQILASACTKLAPRIPRENPGINVITDKPAQSGQAS